MTNKKNELSEYELAWLADIQAEQSRIEAEQLKKDADRESAMAKLKKLGLTDDEIAALVP
jgi:uncharacterized small protein (DUF1192 family)